MSINTIVVGDEKPVIFMSTAPRGEFEGEFDSYDDDEEEDEYEDDEELTGELDFDSFGGEDDENEMDGNDDELGGVDGLTTPMMPVISTTTTTTCSNATTFDPFSLNIPIYY